MNERERHIAYGLKQFSIKDFRGIEHTAFEAMPADVPWIFLTGQNGYGKTCLLQALFLGLWGRVDDSGVLLEESPKFKIEVSGYKLGQYEPFAHQVSQISISGTWSGAVKNVPVAAYGPNRLSLQGASENEAIKRSTDSYSLFNPDGVLLNIEHELKSWFFRSAAKELKDVEAQKLRNRFQDVKQALVQLLPNICDIIPDPRTNKLYYVEESMYGERFPQKRTLQEISSGSKSIMAMAGDMMIRLFRRQEEASTPADLEGIVIIDELDLHLHPKWQKALPGLLSKVFPKVQFIASTHSPIPFLGAPAGSIFLKVERNLSDGIYVEEVKVPMEDLTPNLILSSPIFGFSEIFPITHDANGYIRTEDLYQDMVLTDRVEDRLRAYAGSKEEQQLLKLFRERKKEAGDDTE